MSSITKGNNTNQNETNRRKAFSRYHTTYVTIFHHWPMSRLNSQLIITCCDNVVTIRCALDSWYIMESNLDVIKFIVNINKDEKREKEVRGFVSSLSHEHCESFHARVHPFSSFREQSIQHSVQLWHNYLHSVELIFCTIQKYLSSFFPQHIPAAAAAAVTDQALCETQLKSRVWLHKSPFPDMSQFKENLELE